MIIIGAKGFASEVLEVLYQNKNIDNVAFYDDYSNDEGDFKFDIFPILKTTNEVKEYFMKTNNEFTLGVGGPKLRKELSAKFILLGGELMSAISPHAHIGHFNISIGAGCNIMTGTVITNNISIGSGCLLNLNCTIGHDSNIGNFVEISPGAHVSGNCIIGDYCSLGTNATILPKICIGRNVVVGAGSVVTKNVPDNSLVIGVPAQIIRQLPEID